MTYKHLYGPIPSRRLGVSLGVDLIPFKTCPLNCIYCECGATNNFTLTRKEYISTEEIITEIKHFMAHNHPPDFITFSGSGEPTLHAGLGLLINFIKKSYPETKVAVITNSVMLTLDDVQDDLMEADLVAPSMDAVTQDVFNAIDLPMKGIKTDEIIHSLQIFAQKYLAQPNKELWLEIFVVQNINDTDSEIQHFIDTLQKISYSRIQLNRLDRIGTKIDLVPAPMESLYKIQDAFIKSGLKNIEIIGKFKHRNEMKNYHHSVEDTITLNLERRSMSLEDLMIISDKSMDEISIYLDILSSEKKIISQIINGNIVYKIFHKK
ncbi:MAG: radical SAM protein [Brevinema sp.]